VNIITKRPTDKLSGSVSLYALKPQDSDESDTKRIGFNLAGPISDRLSFRLYGSANKTDADSPSLNARASGIDVTDSTVPPAGPCGTPETKTAPPPIDHFRREIRRQMAMAPSA